ncbi:MAG: hypothetical protein JEZ08_13265 [Clostridiales bacterium]|nr:hypothetical protein [Clostridiales bacterium]
MDNEFMRKRYEFRDNLNYIISNASTFTPNKFSKTTYGDKTFDYDSLVLAIDSSWGTGKSHFINDWMSDKKDSYTMFFYNAWEYDDHNDALVPLLYTMYEELSKHYSDDDEFNNFKMNSINLILNVGKEIGKGLIRRHLNIEPEAITKALDNTTFEKSVSQIDNYFKEFKAIHDVKTSFKNTLFTLCQKSKENNKPMIIIIDELDRCRPLYAIETLEVIKHFFNIPDLTFLIALDVKQLSHSIATVYGQDMDSMGYLHRFFDMHLSLPEPNHDDFLSILDNYSGDINIFFREHARTHKLTLREIKKLLPNYLLFFKNKLYDEGPDIQSLYTLLYIIKFAQKDLYQIIMKSSFDNNGNVRNNNFVGIDSSYFSGVSAKPFNTCMIKGRNKLTFLELLVDCRIIKNLDVRISATHELIGFTEKFLSLILLKCDYLELYQGRLPESLNNVTVAQYIDNILQSYIVSDL